MTDDKVLHEDKPTVKKKAKTKGCPFDPNYPVDDWEMLDEPGRKAYRYALEQSPEGRKLIAECEK